MILKWISIIALTHLCTAIRVSPEVKIVNDILKNYSRRVVGRLDHRPQLVKVGLTLVQLHSLDEKNQMLTSSGWFQVEWNDYRLRWNKSEYDLDSIVVPSKELWLPDIGFLNSASIYHPSMIRNEFRCIVYHDGWVLWTPGGTYHTTCELDISNFPFDKQACYIHLTNWAYNVGEMNLTMSSSSIIMESYKPSAEWQIIDTYVTREEVVYDCCGNVSYPALYFHVRIERKSLYYIVNIILPCILLSILANFAFCVPPDSGEKISLGITLLLSFTVFQLIVAENIPRRSDSIPILSLYIVLITAVVTASIICTIFVSHLHHRGKEPMPNILRVLTFDILARITCLGRLRDTHGSSAPLHKKRQPSRTDVQSGRSSSNLKLKLLNGNSPLTESLLSKVTGNIDSKQPELLNNTRIISSIDKRLEHIIETLSEHESRRVSQENSNAIKNEWYAAGKVFDRFFFVIYILILAVITTRFVIPILGNLTSKHNA